MRSLHMRAASAAVFCAAILLVLVGCGSNSSHDSATAQQLQINRAAAQAAAQAQQAQKLRDLQAQLNQLKHSKAASATKTVVEAVTVAVSPSASAVAAPSPVYFHAPSGDVSCEIDGDGRTLCSVADSDQTFEMPSGGAAHIESGARLPRGNGPLADWGQTVSNGSVTCTVPLSDQPRGITCIDSDTGHGFQASKVPARQQAY